MADHDNDAHAMLLRVPRCAAWSRDHAARWWNEVRSAGARRAGRRRSAAGAWRWSDHAGFTVGDQYAEQQFLAGFIALRFLKDPPRRWPISRGWTRQCLAPDQQVARRNIGRAAPMRRWATPPARCRHYRLAAAYPETFYGQIALARIEAAPVLHLNDTAVEAGGRGRSRMPIP